MTVYEIVRARLLGAPAIVALVAARVYPLRLPQGSTLTSIVLTRVSSVRYGHLRGPASLARPRVQVDCWATTFDEASTLAGLVRQQLDAYVGTYTDGSSPEVVVPVSIAIDGEVDWVEPEIHDGLYRSSADYVVFHGTNEGEL